VSTHPSNLDSSHCYTRSRPAPREGARLEWPQLAWLWLLLWFASTGCDGVASMATEKPGSGGDGGATAASALFFRPDIQEQLESAACFGCHAAGSVPMKAKKGPKTDAEWEQNFAEVRGRAGKLAEKATGGGGHAALVGAGEAVLSNWKAWAASGAPFAAGNPNGAGGGGSATLTVDAGTPLTWMADIAPLMAAKCTSCHGSSGNYSLQSLTSAKGPGTDAIPNILPGDASSVLVTYCRDGHQGIGAVDGLKVARWVVDWNAVER
jgi:hypothetical protein